jgi:hypothetical protein
MKILNRGTLELGYPRYRDVTCNRIHPVTVRWFVFYFEKMTSGTILIAWRFDGTCGRQHIGDLYLPVIWDVRGHWEHVSKMVHGQCYTMRLFDIIFPLPLGRTYKPICDVRRQSQGSPAGSPLREGDTCIHAGNLQQHNSLSSTFLFGCSGTGPPLWSSGQSSWLLTQRSWVQFLALLDFLSRSMFGTGSTQPLWG